jgi:hypothetical protein
VKPSLVSLLSCGWLFLQGIALRPASASRLRPRPVVSHDHTGCSPPRSTGNPLGPGLPSWNSAPLQSFVPDAAADLPDGISAAVPPGSLPKVFRPPKGVPVRRWYSPLPAFLTAPSFFRTSRFHTFRTAVGSRRRRGCLPAHWPRALSGIHVLQRFPPCSSLRPLGPRAPLPFLKAAKHCSGTGSLAAPTVR